MIEEHIPARVLNERGIEEFTSYICELKNGGSPEKPDLNRKPYSEPFPADIEVMRGGREGLFSTKLELAKYIWSKLQGSVVSRADVRMNTGFWSWLAYEWFETICEEKDGRLAPKELARYICSNDYTDYYRHLIAGPYDIFTIQGSKLSKPFLNTKPWVLGELTEQIASRQYIIASRALGEVIYTLYYDEENDRLKRGALGKGPGSPRRFAKVVNQLELTYFVHGMKPEEIIGILPEEFHVWLW